MIGPAKIIRRQPAGDSHQVATVRGGQGSYRRTPCQDCPWRRDAVGKFPAEAFVRSANTGVEHLEAPQEDGETSLNERFNEVSHTFGCHRSGLERPATCAGYILNGYAALGWRIAASTGRFDHSDVSDGGVALFGSYLDMAVANGVSPDHPALVACRPWRGNDHGNGEEGNAGGAA